ELWEFETSGWSDYFRYQRTVRTSIAEVVENIFDLAHGQFVHQNDGGNSAPQVTYSFEDHAAHIVFDIDLPLVGGRTNHEVSLCELGFNVNRATGFGSKAFMGAYTP